MKVDAIECPNCGCIVYSRARHDFRSCGCGNCFVDGGPVYTRVGGAEIHSIRHHTLELNLTPQQLYDDWNYGNDVYGIITPQG